MSNENLITINGQQEEIQKLEIDFSGIPKALGKHVFPDFISFIGEFIDNAVSAAHANESYFNINIYIQEENEGLSLCISDKSGGIDQDLLCNLVFNPACCPPKKGFLNNHGIGMKQALYVQQYENRKNWNIVTATKKTIDENYAIKIDGPLISNETSISKIKLNHSSWNSLDRQNSEQMKIPGTRIFLFIDEHIMSLFNNIDARSKILKSKINRLHENLAWHYGPMLNDWSKITVYWKAKSKSDWVEEKIFPIHPIWKMESSDVRLEKTFNIEWHKNVYQFQYRCGLLALQSEIMKDPNFKKNIPNWYIFPTRKYKKTPANAGVDFIIGGDNGKRIFRMPISQFFHGDTSKLAHESYHGQLICPRNLPSECTNNIKNTINIYHPIMAKLVTDVSRETLLTPRQVCQTLKEAELYKSISIILDKIGKPIPQFKVTEKIDYLKDQKIDFLLQTDDYTYEAIEVSLILDLAHIYKLHAYRTAIERGWSSIDMSDKDHKPTITYKIIAKLPPDNKNLSKVMDLFDFVLEDPSEYNIDYDTIKQQKVHSKNKGYEE